MIASFAQPYFFPYIGYFQLIAASDVFVVYDDAQYMKNGWVNRNRILGKSGPEWLTFPVEHAPHTLTINQRRYVSGGKRTTDVLLTKLATRYREAANFEATMKLVEGALSYPDRGVASFNNNLIRRVCEFLDVGTRIEVASELRVKKSSGVQAVIDMCLLLEADHYLNPIGGTDLYSPAAFSANGLALSFLKPELHVYPQFGLPFQPGLSIIDVLMFNSKACVRHMLDHCQVMQA